MKRSQQEQRSVSRLGATVSPMVSPTLGPTVRATLALVVASTVATLVVLTGCGRVEGVETTRCVPNPGPGAAITCEVPGTDRGYDLLLPTSYNGDDGVPLIVAFHGGGSSKEGALSSTCRDGDVSRPRCLHNEALARGYAVVAPNGTSGAIGQFRTWNAGGGVDGWRCTSGVACEDNVDDMAFFDAMLADVGSRATIDLSRVYATGISNGGAISHRLACERSGSLAGIVTVGGAMQLTVAQPCDPSDPVPILHIHGTGDTCWNYEGGAPTCSNIVGQPGLAHVSVDRTLSEWAGILACEDTPVTTEWPATADDDTTVTAFSWQGCAQDLTHWRVNGGGHTWPSGYQYLGEATVGRVTYEIDNAMILDWIDAHP